MARRHSMQGHAASVAGATYTQRGRATTPGPLDDEVEIDAADTAEHRIETITSNPLSGPITVPQRVTIGDTGLSGHPLALGGSTFGWTVDAEAAFAVLDRYAGTGGAILDTADSFAAGRSESIIGQWMASRGTRDRMVVSTRVGRHPEHRALGAVDLVSAVDDSLRRLGIDRIDLLCFHDDDVEVPLEERLGAVDALIAAGKVRAIGASDFSPERLIEARVLAANGLPRFEALTTRYNLLDRRPFEGAPELVAHAQGLSVLPYFALANGFLAGGVRRRSDARHDARGARQAAHLGRRGHRVLAALDAVAFAHGVQPATIALAWLLAKPTVAAPVVSATRPEQVEALMAAADVELQRSELVELDRASA
ncbi:aldo/keto reductase [Agromyces sp. SYSU K20354]|uniref:aldo/keto reductase n=1 Tax=Agromyces cavernae TaxID=2898659 RepID=UPI001E2E6A08|nr:aldo/keto reductase [Agromyces cavernae]MCD2443782.1 aldo/keto reductase [Agromyces cavernae]